MSRELLQMAALAAPAELVAWSRDRFDLPAWVAALERSIQARKVSAKDVCAATGIVESSLSRIRAGKHAPDAASLAALSAWAGINPVSFCTMPVTPPAAQPAPAVREPLIDEMDAVASKYAHKMALDLECVLSNYIGPWYDTAMQTLSEYRMAMNAIHERESPTHMGEPFLPKRGITGTTNE